MLALASGLALLVGAPAGLGPGIAAALAGLLAGMRPLAALEVVVAGRTTDRWLAWSPLQGGA
ncbi:hypothetical protein D3C83_151630 [compost metagenome]